MCIDNQAFKLHHFLYRFVPVILFFWLFPALENTFFVRRLQNLLLLTNAGELPRPPNEAFTAASLSSKNCREGNEEASLDVGRHEPQVLWAFFGEV